VAEGIAEALVELLAHPERRQTLGRAARAHAEERFDPSRNARTVEQLYFGLLEAEPSVVDRVAEAAVRA
jgi:glycosyltransferase involved in cell wall biosynthesis